MKIPAMHGWETMEVVAKPEGGFTITYGKTIKHTPATGTGDER